MKIEQFNKQNIQFLRKEINEALKAVGDKHNISLEIQNVRYDDNSFNTKLQAFATGTSENVKEIEWNKHCYLFDLNKEMFGKSFSHQNQTFTIVGIKPRSRKYPVLAQDNSGKTYKFPVDIVKMVLTEEV